MIYPMRFASKVAALLALALTIVPPVLFAVKTMPEPTMKLLMFAGCVLWFIAAPWWLKGGSE